MQVFTPKKTHLEKTVPLLCCCGVGVAASCYGHPARLRAPRPGACAGLPSRNASHPALTLVPPSKNTSWRGAKHNSRFLLLPSFPGSHIITGLGRESKPGTRGWEP